MTGRTASERANVSTICRHLALVAIDGATDEVALTMSPGFRLHLDGATLDRSGYLTLIDANHAAHPHRPPLDLLEARGYSEFVTALLEPRCVAHYRIVDDVIVEMWITQDWHAWSTGLLAPTA